MKLFWFSMVLFVAVAGGWLIGLVVQLHELCPHGCIATMGG
jgi:hypothetical protein